MKYNLIMFKFNTIRWQLVTSTTENTSVYQDVESTNMMLRLCLNQAQMMVVVLAVTLKPPLSHGNRFFMTGMYFRFIPPFLSGEFNFCFASDPPVHYSSNQCFI